MEDDAEAWLSVAAALRREPILKAEARLKMEARVPVLDALEVVLLRSDMVGVSAGADDGVKRNKREDQGSMGYRIVSEMESWELS